MYKENLWWYKAAIIGLIPPPFAPLPCIPAMWNYFLMLHDDPEMPDGGIVPSEDMHKYDPFPPQRPQRQEFH